MVSSDFSLALHCILLLAVDEERRRTSNELALDVSVHPVRIRKVLSQLKKNGIIRSMEGNGGGFLIAMKPHEITLDMIYVITSQKSLKPKLHQCDMECNLGQQIENTVSYIFNEADANLRNFLKEKSVGNIISNLGKKPEEIEGLINP